MQYRSATLLALATYFAIVFASMAGPADFWADALPLLRTTFIATCVVLFFNSEGRLKTLLLTFLAFYTLFVFTTETPRILQRFLSALIYIFQGGYYGKGLTRSLKLILHENFSMALSLIAVTIAHALYSKVGTKLATPVFTAEPRDATE